MTEGDVYTVAGSMNGTQGTSGLGGLASSALLSGVTGIGTDAVGDLFVADTYNHQVDEVPTATATVGASYTYNGDSLEASRTSSGMLTQFTWGELAGSGLPTIISDGANDYVYGPTGEPVEQVSLATSAPTYLTYTPSGSSWLSTNETGNETGFWRYDAFGTLAYGTPTSPFGYSGQYNDASTGLVNDRARWYQAQTGEFTTRDPDLSSTGTAYAYAGDDPVNSSDPDGDCPSLPTGVCYEPGPGLYPYWDPIIDMTVAAQQPLEAAYNEYVNEARRIPLPRRAVDRALNVLQSLVNRVFEDVIGTINENAGPPCGTSLGGDFTQAASDAHVSNTDLAEGSLAYVVFIISPIVDDPYGTFGFSSYLVRKFVQTDWAQQILLDKEIDWADNATAGRRHDPDDLRRSR